MDELIVKLNELCDSLKVDLAKASAGNKAAAARARKATLEIAKVGKEFRKVSVQG